MIFSIDFINNTDINTIVFHGLLFEVISSVIGEAIFFFVANCLLAISIHAYILIIGSCAIIYFLSILYCTKALSKIVLKSIDKSS